jgi:hypothetical protein
MGVVVARATCPTDPDGLRPNHVQVAFPWCENDTCALSWGIVMHQAMVWAKVADHHGCFGHRISAETRVNFMTHKES